MAGESSEKEMSWVLEMPEGVSESYKELIEILMDGLTFYGLAKPEDLARDNGDVARRTMLTYNQFFEIR